jgi:hypothetical protein
MEHLYHFVKDNDFGLELESATPPVDQPVVEMDQSEVRKMECLTSTLWDGLTAAMLFSFI